MTRCQTKKASGHRRFRLVSNPVARLDEVLIDGDGPSTNYENYKREE